MAVVHDPLLWIQYYRGSLERLVAKINNLEYIRMPGEISMLRCLLTASSLVLTRTHFCQSNDEQLFVDNSSLKNRSALGFRHRFPSVQNAGDSPKFSQLNQRVISDRWPAGETSHSNLIRELSEYKRIANVFLSYKVISFTFRSLEWTYLYQSQSNQCLGIEYSRIGIGIGIDALAEHFEHQSMPRAKEQYWMWREPIGQVSYVHSDQFSFIKA